jgi:hypothetical protein
MPEWKQTQNPRQVSDGRKVLYYSGIVVSALGMLLFLSNFLIIGGAMNAGASSGPGPGGFMGRALGGMALLVLGQFMRKVGQRGLAGSGLVLDPEQARKDVEPWSRLAGGMVKDGLDEAGFDLGAREKVELDFADRLRKLKELHDEGVLTDEEFEREKRDVLESI